MPPIKRLGAGHKGGVGVGLLVGVGVQDSPSKFSGPDIPDAGSEKAGEAERNKKIKKRKKKEFFTFIFN